MKIKGLPDGIGAFLLNVLLPRTCAHCREDLGFRWEWPLCPACRGGLEPAAGARCRRCFGPAAAGGEYCAACAGAAAAPGLELARAAFVFGPELRSLIHAFKYRGRKGLARPLGLELARAHRSMPELGAYLFVVPVPLSPGKERERGFNQSALLAGTLAAERRLFLLENAAERVRDTPSQTGLSGKGRRENVKGAFRIPKPELVRGRRVLIVDDVATTLATAEELAGELMAAGARGVALLSLAREPLAAEKPGKGE